MPMRVSAQEMASALAPASAKPWPRHRARDEATRAPQVPVLPTALDGISFAVQCRCHPVRWIDNSTYAAVMRPRGGMGAFLSPTTAQFL